MNIEVPKYAQDFTVDGNTTGKVSVTDSSGFYVGCIAYLGRDDAGARVIIVSIPDATHVGVRIIADDNEQQLPVQIYGGLSDLTGWTTAKHSRLSMPQQLAKIEKPFLKPATENI